MPTMFSNVPLVVNKYNTIDVAASKVAAPQICDVRFFFIKDFTAYIHLSCK